MRYVDWPSSKSVKNQEEKRAVFWAGFAAVAAMVFGALMVLGGFGSASVFIMAVLA